MLCFGLVQESYQRAQDVLKGHHRELKSVMNALLQYETLDAEDMKLLVEGKKLQKNLDSKPQIPSKPPTTSASFIKEILEGAKIPASTRNGQPPTVVKGT